jgi:threonine/homoserine/homoserine lactone efflux protein
VASRWLGTLAPTPEQDPVVPTHFPAFVLTVALLAILPGANNASITRQTLVFGRRAGLSTVAGASAGILVWAIAAAAGLSAVLLANPGAYVVIRLGGAVVLCALGSQTLWSLRRPAVALPKTVEERKSGEGRRSFLVGAATSLGNPKAGVFAVSLLPQFVTAQGPVLASCVALGVVWASVSGAWFCCFVWAIDKGRSRVTRPKFRQVMQALTGVTLLCLGIAVAAGA